MAPPAAVVFSLSDFVVESELTTHAETVGKNYSYADSIDVTGKIDLPTTFFQAIKFTPSDWQNSNQPLSSNTLTWSKTGLGNLPADSNPANAIVDYTAGNSPGGQFPSATNSHLKKVSGTIIGSMAKYIFKDPYLYELFTNYPVLESHIQSTLSGDFNTKLGTDFENVGTALLDQIFSLDVVRMEPLFADYSTSSGPFSLPLIAGDTIKVLFKVTLPLQVDNYPSVGGVKSSVSSNAPTTPLNILVIFKLVDSV